VVGEHDGGQLLKQLKAEAGQAEAEGTAPIVMALGGWRTERMMRRYAAVTDQTLRAAAEAVSGSETAQPPARATTAR
jgi:hypothetical protein